MKKAALLCVCLGFSFIALCHGRSLTLFKDSIPRRAGLTLSYHPYDFFLSAQYTLQKQRFEPSFRLGTGVRTVCQGRLFPRASAQLGFHFIKSDKLQAGALIRSDFSFVRVNRFSSHSTQFFEEITPGLFVGFGQKVNYRLSAGSGPMWEQTWSNQDENYRTWFTWSHFVELSVSYAL